MFENLKQIFTAKSNNTLALSDTITKAPKTVAPYQLAVRRYQFAGAPKRGARILRAFALQCDPVRTVINRRKSQISQADWHIVKADGTDADPRVVKAFMDLIRFVNPTRLSFRSFLDQLIEDILVLDAGCFEKEKTRSGKTVALWPVDGGTIEIVADWDGTDLNAPRYIQKIDYQTTAQLRNDQLVYIMQHPRTYDAYGISPVEMLVKVIEAELYASGYEKQQLEQANPNGILYLGEGVSPEDVDAFKNTWEDQIAGAAATAILGGGSEPNFIPFSPHSNADQQLLAYHQWLCKKIASVFCIDPQVLGLTDNVNKANGKVLQTMSDEGHVALANCIAEYITRELLWEIDENHRFEFKDLNRRDALAQAKIDQIYSGIGAVTINEIRKREGMQPVAWGDEPYSINVGPSDSNRNSTDNAGSSP